MPRESCIQHPKRERMIILRETYLHLLEGDRCGAAILALFEYLTNAELHRMELAEEDGEPWFRASTSAIIADLMNDYQEASVRRAVGRLADLGLVIESQRRIGEVKSYLLDCDLINDLLARRAIASKRLDSTGKNDRWPSLPSTDVSTDVTTDGSLYSKKSNEVEKKTSPTPSFEPNPKTERNLTSAVVPSIAETFDKGTGTVGEDTDYGETPDTGPRDRSYIDCEDLESSTPAANRTDWARAARKQKQHDVKARKKEAQRQERLAEAAQRERFKDAARDRVEGEPRSSSNIVHDQPAPAEVPRERDCVSAWNEAFPDMAVDPSIYSNGNKPWPLRDGSLAAQMDKVIAKVRWLKENGSVIQFGELLKAEKGGGFKWQTILAGGLDWTTQKKVDRRSAKDAFLEEQRRKTDEQLEAFKRARNQNQGTPA